MDYIALSDRVKHEHALLTKAQLAEILTSRDDPAYRAGITRQYTRMRRIELAEKAHYYTLRRVGVPATEIGRLWRGEALATREPSPFARVGVTPRNARWHRR